MIAPLGENVLLLKMLLASNGIVVLEKQIDSETADKNKFKGQLDDITLELESGRQKGKAEKCHLAGDFGKDSLISPILGIGLK